MKHIIKICAILKLGYLAISKSQTTSIEMMVRSPYPGYRVCSRFNLLLPLLEAKNADGMYNCTHPNFRCFHSAPGHVLGSLGALANEWCQCCWLTQ